MNSAKQSYIVSRFVILLSILFAVCLGFAVWNINPWPTDAEVYYMPAALRIPQAQYLSEIHITEGIENVRWLHGKEFYVAGISLFQFLLNDFESLRPLMLLGLVAIALSSILIFYIARRFWGQAIALFCYLAFVFCLWPYIYILFAKHQTLGLMFFLLAVTFLLNVAKFRFRPVWFFLSGLTFGLMLFSSTVGSLYVPYYIAAFLLVALSLKHENVVARLKALLGGGLLVLAGFLIVFFYVNLPDIFLNIKNFAEYVHISGAFNHFYYNQIALQQWFPHINVGEVRAGWIWIFKYLVFILPVLFPLYISAVAYLCWRIFRVPGWSTRLKIIGIIALSVSSPVLAEAAKVAQYGSNYFPVIIGILVLLGYALQDAFQKINFKSSRVKTLVWSLGIGFFILHVGINSYLFVVDVFIPRMATTFLSEKIKSLEIDRLATYRVHHHRNQFVYCLSPDVREKIHWFGIKSLSQMDYGYVLVPPATGDSLYIASSTSYNNYDKDSVLVQLMRKNLLSECAVASFRTLASSRIWQQEEEILSYRDLILGQRFPEDAAGRVWILDAQKVKAQKSKIALTADEQVLLEGSINNIGTAEKFYMFEGQRVAIRQTMQAQFLLTQLWKKGNPEDSLIASVYRIDSKEPIWLPAGQHFTSQPLPAKRVQADADSGITVFNFDPPLELERGVYSVVIYRTGQPDNQNYYRINNQRFAMK